MAVYELGVNFDDWVKETKERMREVVRSSADDVIIRSQTPRSKGGRMRVKTGFLRASGRASLNGLPSGPSVRPKDAKKNSYNWEGAPFKAAQAVILTMDLGDVLTFGWTANYAEVRDTFDGFLTVELQKWSDIVTANANELRERAS